ncbi:DNA-binding response regulator, NarL/FixJ family, contains REC and HTH domains [Mariprofundus ferrinatatus]|uniref:DNA-binding response regulator, NarL/FixJ family, contains REC and HTH domains n=1 Tax=Mariprofundus ferrinatatus TaxID=1921087 RepID=A0A2K8L615_9PROT|nr:response regulator transcription factor [Mariprofundus ferrinatatus]ATX81689.1 DNA-binding response regulator, NarL/FixJ family, contains REC and HTH domains [Mariprofundus ferrinatatus]
MKILIADDHCLHRELVRTFLAPVYPEALIYEASDYFSVKEICKNNQPTIVLLDLSMPNMNGLLSVNKLVSRFPDSKFIVCSASEHPILIQTVMGFGAAGFIPKTLSCRELITGIRYALEGDEYLPPSLNADANITLTQRQSEILGYICSGYSNKEIAARLDLSLHTVKFHAGLVFEKLKVQNRQQLISLIGLHKHPNQDAML